MLVLVGCRNEGGRGGGQCDVARIVTRHAPKERLVSDDAAWQIVGGPGVLTAQFQRSSTLVFCSTAAAGIEGIHKELPVSVDLGPKRYNVAVAGVHVLARGHAFPVGLVAHVRDGAYCFLGRW